MSGRGRGRGGRGGSNKSFSKEQLTSLGVGGNEALPGPVTQPPPLYPMLERRPVALNPTLESDYLLILRQDYIDHMQLSAAYIKKPVSKSKTPEHEIEKLIAQIPNTKEKFDWNMFPAELRPKVIPRRMKKIVIKKEVDIDKHLEKLEQLESKQPLDANIKEEVDETAEDEEHEIEGIEDPEDEEMDDGTDYANNYFDNGENYEDEDDALDDGPIY